MSKLDKDFLQGIFYSARLDRNDGHLHLCHKIYSNNKEFNICIYCGTVFQKDIKNEFKIYIDEDKMWEY